MATIPREIADAARASHKKWGIPASISLAQWAVESGWGRHSPGNNPFGIKARPGEPTQLLWTREVIHGRSIRMQQPFRKYGSIEEAFEAHAELLARRGVYAKARTKLPDVDAFADALTGVYATDPHYGEALRRVITGSHLKQFDA